MSTIVTRAAKGSALTWTEGDSNFTNLNNDKLENVVEDTSPTLGGDLDVDSYKIVSPTDTDLTIKPGGIGNVNLEADTVVVGDAAVNAFITSATGSDLFITRSGGNTTNTPRIELIAGGAGSELNLTAQNISISSTSTAVNLTDVKSATNYTAASVGLNLKDVNGNNVIRVGFSGNFDCLIYNPTLYSTSNGNIELNPDGTGDVYLTADTVRVGDANSNATITTNGTGNLTLNTNSGTNAGSIVLYNGVDGAITIDPNGNGNINLVTNGTNSAVVIGNGTGTGIVTSNGAYDLTLLCDPANISGQAAIQLSASTGHVNLSPGVVSGASVRSLSDKLFVGTGSAATTITSNGANNLVLNTNNGTNSGSITLNQGANGNIAIVLNGTGALAVSGIHVGGITSTANSSPITGRHTATASSSIANYSLNAQKHRTDIALASMTAEPAVIGFSVRDNTNTNRFFGRLMGVYQGSSTNPYFQFTYSTDGFTTSGSAVTLGGGQAVFGATNSAYTITTNGTGNLTLNTNSGTNSGSIVLAQGTNGDITYTTNGTGVHKFVGDVQLNAQGDLKFADSDSSNWVAFQAPATISSNVTWTLPSTDGTNGQVLSTNGTGTLSWATAGGGGSSVPELAIAYATAYYEYTSNNCRFNWSTEHLDSGSWLTLGTGTDAGKFTITTAGTYLIELFGNASLGDAGGGTSLYDTTGAATLNSRNPNRVDVSTDTYIWPDYCYIHTISASNTYEFRHDGCATTALKTNSRAILKITKR